MPAIMVMNPFHKGQKKKKKLNLTKIKNPITKHGGVSMAEKKAVVKYRAPSKKAIAKAARSISHKAKGRAKLSFAGLHIGEAAKTGMFAAIGILAAQASAKKFADSGGVADNWTWKNYLLALAGSGVVAFAVSALTGGRTKAPQAILAGGFAYTGWKLFQSEVVQGNPKLEEYFGEEPTVDGVGFGADELHPDYQGYGTPQQGDLWQGDDGSSYVMGEQGWLPTDESHRIGDDIAQVNPRMGEDLVLGDDIAQVNPRMGADDYVTVGFGGSNLGSKFKKRFGVAI